MIQNLYNEFKYWSDGGSVWLISDSHFDDENTHLMNPNWIEPDEYINVLNKLINKNDTLICLGDCGNIERFKDLKAGYKVLIKGNHDNKGDSKYLKTTEHLTIEVGEYKTEGELLKYLRSVYPKCKYDIFKCYDFQTALVNWEITIDNNLFDEVYSGPLFIAPQILLSHEPIYGLKFCTNIHGHWHNGIYDYTDSQGGRHLNIAADVVGYQPVDLGKLIKAGLIAGLPTIHRLTIDKAIENPIHK